MFMYTFVVCSENVTEMKCMFFTYMLDTEIINDKSKLDMACVVAPYSWGVGDRSVTVGFSNLFSLLLTRMPAWVSPYIPFLISASTHPSGVTYLFRSYSSIDYWGILLIFIRRYSFVVKSVFKYILTRLKPNHFAPGVERVLLMSIFAVERSAVGVPSL